MTCNEPELSRRVLEEGLDDPRWADHRSSCPSCRLFTADVRRLTESASHPDAEDLVRFDEADPRLGAARRAELASHLQACGPCRRALEAVPREVARTSSWRLRPLTFVAAAGWIIAAVLFFNGPQPPRASPSSADPLAGRMRDVVLSAVRGDVAEPSAFEAVDWIRLRFVIGEDVAVGSRLSVAVSAEGDDFGPSWDLVVSELDDRGRPTATVGADRVPAGPIRMRVRTSTGREVEYRTRLR